MTVQYLKYAIRNGSQYYQDRERTDEWWGSLETAFLWDSQHVAQRASERGDEVVSIEILDGGERIDLELNTDAPSDLPSEESVPKSYLVAERIIGSAVESGSFKSESFKLILSAEFISFAAKAADSAVAAARAQWIDELQNVTKKAQHLRLAAAELEQSLSRAAYVIQGKSK